MLDDYPLSHFRALSDGSRFVVLLLLGLLWLGATVCVGFSALGGGGPTRAWVRRGLFALMQLMGRTLVAVTRLGFPRVTARVR